MSKRKKVPEAALEMFRKWGKQGAKFGAEGGRKGGPARKEALTPERRTEIARNAAKKRWGNRSK